MKLSTKQLRKLISEAIRKQPMFKPGAKQRLTATQVKKMFPEALAAAGIEDYYNINLFNWWLEHGVLHMQGHWPGNKFSDTWDADNGMWIHGMTREDFEA